MYYSVKSEIHPVVTGGQVACQAPSARLVEEGSKVLPLKVSPLLSSTSIGEPCAAVRSERGSYRSFHGKREGTVPFLLELGMMKMW